MCISRSNGSIAPMVPDRSANSSMRSPVTVNSHGWVLWALAADRGPDEIQWVVSRRVRLILAAVAPARADTACGPPRPSAKTRGGTDPHRPSGTRRVEGFMSTIQPTHGPERDLGDERHWQRRGIGSGEHRFVPTDLPASHRPGRRPAIYPAELDYRFEVTSLSIPVRCSSSFRRGTRACRCLAFKVTGHAPAGFAPRVHPVC